MVDDAIFLQDMVVVESSDFPEANDDGTITVPANEERGLIEYEPATGESRSQVHAIGATDAQGVQYRMRYGGEEISFTTESPLGQINEPFSFTEAFGKPLTAGAGTVQYTAVNSNDQPIDLVGRMFVEVL